MFTVVAFVCCCLVIVGGSPPGKLANAVQFVLGGVDAPEGAIPYQVSLRNNYNRSLCGGAILDKRWVLSAAHCTLGRSKDDFKVAVGSNDLLFVGGSYPVETIKNHENYTDVYKGYDISLIKVSSDIKYSHLVQPISLPETEATVGADVVVSGWGWITNEGEKTNHLQMATLKVLSNEQCQKEFNGQFTILPSQICTFTKPGQGTCRGDSGGPLVDDHSLVGIVSWGIPCAVGSPDVFTRVYSFKNWIHENMSK